MSPMGFLLGFGHHFEGRQRYLSISGGKQDLDGWTKSRLGPGLERDSVASGEDVGQEETVVLTENDKLDNGGGEKVKWKDISL